MRQITSLFLLFGFLISLQMTILPSAVAQTSGTGLPLPRFVSLRATEVNMRTGPGIQYPVDWVYKRQYLPMEVVAEYGTWRKIRDWEGNQGWIHQSMLSGRRTLMVTKEMRSIRLDPESKSLPTARVEPGAIGNIVSCSKDSGWCQVEFGKHEGWLRRVDFWGVYRKEIVD